jgi:hypothetical protein
MKKPVDDGDRKPPLAETSPSAHSERPKPDTMKSCHGSDDQITQRRDRH